jgi:isopentenyldiphosphate isomerase
LSASHELLDVVDVNDQLIGVKSRGEIHAGGLMHRAVHILVFNSRGELFLQKRSLRKDEQPGKWDSSAAGHVDSGEDYLACACREIGEELGITLERPLQALFKLPASEVTGNEHCMVYQYCFDGPLRLQADEIDEGHWIEPAAMDLRVDAGDSALTEALRLIWKRYREVIQPADQDRQVPGRGPGA